MTTQSTTLLTLKIAIAFLICASARMEEAMAEPTRWLYSTPGSRPIISGNDTYVRLWTPEPELYDKSGPGTFPFDAIGCSHIVVELRREDGESMDEVGFCWRTL